jgi:hypothetical protein
MIVLDFCGPQNTNNGSGLRPANEGQGSRPLLAILPALARAALGRDSAKNNQKQGKYLPVAPQSRPCRCFFWVFLFWLCSLCPSVMSAATPASDAVQVNTTQHIRMEQWRGWEGARSAWRRRPVDQRRTD